VTLRPYQEAAVSQLQGGDLLVSPTGTGKTVMLAEWARRQTLAGKRVLWVAHRNELIFQASATLRRWWLEPELNVKVRSIQQLRQGTTPPADVLIVDEAHHLPSDDWSRLRTEQYPDAELVGATATPERGDGRGMGGLFRRIVPTLTVKEAIANGFLVPSTVLRPERPLGPGELAQHPVEAYYDTCRSSRAIIFAPTVDLAIQWACRLRDEKGVPAFAIFGAMTKMEREEKLRLFAEGKVRVLTSVNVLTEGFDVPEVEVVVLARGFGTAGGYLQAVGRGLRPSSGKTGCLVLDLRGASHLHGEPDDDRTYHLDGRGIRRDGDSVDVRFCPVCGAPVAGEECETCGHEGTMRMRPPRVLGLPMARFARIRQDDDDARARRLGRWLGECRSKGWKEGRALHRFKGAYGEWPGRELVNKARALTG
jgi:superfamily II DNA or RNA helicase